jgi:hypothetical protein
MWLKALAIFMALGNAWSAYRCLETYRDLDAHFDPTDPHWPFLVLALSAALNVAFLAAVCARIRWGLFAFLVSNLIATPLVFWLRGFGPIIIGWIGPAVLFVLARSSGLLDTGNLRDRVAKEHS